MLPSSGLFSEISCPFLKRGLCERPHCLYKHERDALQPPAAAELPGIPNYCPTPLSGVLVNGDTSAECLQELERINKEIETIKNEVEKEQRRLSRFQTEQVDGLGAAPERPVSRCGTAGKGVKAGPQRPKYVVDGSRPRTDLEYDPLSNFSADLRSYSSSGREQNGKSGGAKRARKPGGEQSDAGPARESSPEPPDDLLEEGDLVIDIPSSPDKKRSRLHDLCVGQDAAAEAEGVSADIAPTRAANDAKSGSSPELPVPHSDGAEDDTGCPLEAPVARPRDSEPYDVFDGLSRCLENLKSENRRFTRSQAHGVMEESGSDDVDAEAGSPSASSPDPSRAVPVEERAGSPQSAAPCRSDDTNVARLRGEEEEEEEEESSASFPCESLTLAAHQAQRTEQPAHKTAQHQLRSPAPCARRPTDQTQGGGPAAADGGRDRPPSAPVPSASAPAAPLPGGAGVREVILIKSSSEEEPGEELRYSDVDLSDSDPMEECYRIFMEAERADRVERAAAEPEDDADVEEPEVHVKPQPLPPQKRVAHVPKHTESAAASRPQPQVLVPLRGPYPAASAPRIQQVQQRAAALTASVKGGQSFVSSVAPSKTEDGAAPAPPAPPPPPPPPPVSPLTLQPLHQAGQLGSLQNAYVKCIPAGTAVIRVGNNLHFIIPEGSYPLPVTPVPGSVSSVLTPLHAGSVPQVSRALQPTAVMAAHRYRAPGPAPVGSSGSVSPFSTVSTLAQAGSAAAASAPQGAVHVPAKPLTKRKVKQRPERVKDKVPHDVRQRYVNMFTEELLKTSPNVKEAFDKALAEERTVYNRSANKLKYLSVAVNALKRLKNQSAVVAKGDNDTGRKRSKGNIPLHLAKLAVNGDAALYDSLKEYVLHEEKLIENNYPLLHPEKPGGAVLFSDNKKCTNDTLKRLCCRCGATYSVSRTGKHTRKEECTYHYGKGVENRVPGGVETRYSCCEGVMGAPGCQVFKLHVHDAVSLDGFVSTQRREDSDQRCPGVCSLDCEMCYTTHGLELSRVTVVDSSLQVVYDTFVRPENEVIDYNTRFSGISEKDVKKSSPSIREVQQTLLSFISADTIVIGHGLETDLCALKLLHGTVVDTSVVFPHRLGPPHKLTLNNLTADYLRRIIQESVCGHDTADDAAACMELMLWKVKEDGKVKKW